MQLVLSEDQELLAKTAADFVAERSPVARVRQLRDARDPDGFSRALWKEMAELGWLGIPFPESVGGAGMGLAELAVVLEALGRRLAPEPILSCVLLAGQALLLGGSEAQKKQLAAAAGGRREAARPRLPGAPQPLRRAPRRDPRRARRRGLAAHRREDPGRGRRLGGRLRRLRAHARAPRATPPGSRCSWCRAARRGSRWCAQHRVDSRNAALRRSSTA